MFQTTPTSGAAAGAAGAGSSFTFAGGDSLDPRNIDFVASQKALSDYSNIVLKAFTQTRERISEIQVAITDATPNVRRLGGDIKDVSEIITQVAVESRRNVIATSEEVEKLFAIEKTLGLGADVLSKNFLDVGLSIEKIPETLEESMNYVQSIGGNARTVMKDVSDNMGQMNRYQFEGGVQGLTKMAAKASMLRFDMKETFALAEKVLDPDGAIEVAGAFQRLGVAAGNLVDPFQLMNMSINDPSGLQDSLADVAKQFTEFDAETKTFKINPQGVLTLRAMEKEAGLSAGSLSKMGLAASELDQRLSAVDAAGLEIVTEEDKQYLANILKLKDGVYTVTLDDGRTEQLANLQQEEFNNLIQAQKDGPKTLEDTAKASLRLDEISTKNIEAIKAKIVGGILTAPTMQDMNETVRRLTEKTFNTINKDFTTDTARKGAENIFSDLEDDIVNIIGRGNYTPDAILTELMAGSGESFATLGGDVMKKVTDISSQISQDLLTEFKNFKNNTSSSSTTTASPTTTTTTSSYTGPITVDGQTGVNPNFNRGSVPTAPQKPVEVDGDIDINVKFQNLPTGLTPEQIAEVIKTFNMAINEQAFKNYIININRQEIPYTSQGTTVY
jgi:hypothetical protein